MTPKVQVTKTQIGLNQNKNFCAFQEGERQPTEWERMFANHRSDKGFVYKLYQELSVTRDKEGKKDTT